MATAEPRDRRIPEPIVEALYDFRARVEAEFGDRLLDLRLYGSWARGEQHEESDVDVLVVVRDIPQLDHPRVWHLGLDVFYDYDEYVSALVCSEEEWRHLVDRELLIAQDIERDGIPF